jgi:1-deoxy-D-xylulose-5-phosphate synthase
LLDAGRRDPAVVAITAAMPDSTGLLPFASAFPDRFFDVGIAEQHAVATAAGMAAAGMRPVVAIYSTFLSRAFDQLTMDVALHRQPVVFCVDRAGITGPDGPSHHGALDLMLLTKVPGMAVLAPSSAQELEVMLGEALARTDGPTAIRWPSAGAPEAPGGEVGSGLHARRLVGGTDACLIGVGRMVEPVAAAAEMLCARGVTVTAWDARAAAPLDPVMLDDAARHPVVVTVEDGVAQGGVGSAVTAALARRGAPVPLSIGLGLPAAFIPHGTQEELLATLGLTADGVAAATMRALAAAGGQFRPSLVRQSASKCVMVSSTATFMASRTSSESTPT